MPNSYLLLIVPATALALIALLFVDVRPVLRALPRLRLSRDAVPEGATEAYGDELRAMRDIDISDELTTEPMRMVITHTELDEIMMEFRTGIDALCDGIAHRLDPHYERVMVDTGQIDMRELRAMLDAENENRL